MEALGRVLQAICTSSWGPISRQIDYVSNLGKNLEALKWKVRKLHAEMEDVNRKINGKRPTNVCKLWLDEVDKLQKRWTEIEAEYQNGITCLGGRCSNVYARWNLGKRVAELMTEIQEKSDPKGDLVSNEPEKIMPMPKPRAEVNTTTENKLQELLRMINEVSIKRIGLWGMGGVGKTTIMKLLLNHPDIQHMFDIVLWAVVSKEGTNRTVQDQLAQRLKVESLQSEVCKALKDKKFLLLLDDVWGEIDLEEVGIPFLDEEVNGCKVLLSTRSLVVCGKMRTEKDFKIEPLSEEETWLWFRREVEEVVNGPGIEALARQVAKECCGLPLAIDVLAGALRKEKDIHVWRNAVQELRSPSPVSNEIEDMEDRVYGPLKYSYDRLKDERSKERFLFCALFPEDWNIPKVQLTQYWINEGLIDGWNNLEEAKDKGFSKLKQLMDASLLQAGEIYGQECVSMHDVTRDLALRISSIKADGSCKSLVKAGNVELSDSPNAEDWENVKWISFMENDLKTLPQMPPNCSMLTTLLLQGNENLLVIPPNFFEHMPALRVLDLSNTGIHLLPPSIGSLANLRGLFLNDCYRLKAIPSQVGGLAKLEIFQMKGDTRFCSLPLEIGDLASLKHFEVGCGPPKSDEFQAIKMFPKLSKLLGLERLGIDVFEGDAEWWGEFYSEEVSVEISMLNKLTHLLFTFSKIEHLHHFIRQSSSWKRRSLTTFRLAIGQEIYSIDYLYNPMESYLAYPGRQGMIAYNDDTKLKNVSGEMRQILTRVDTLAVGESAAVQRLSEFGLENMNQLKYCRVSNCECMETIISLHDDEDRDNGKKQNSDLLPSLKDLRLYFLRNLKSIWEGPLPSPPPHGRRCFPSLTSLTLIGCFRLKCVFSRGLISHLSNLECLRVEDCSEVEEIISSMEEEGGEEMLPIQILLPRLKEVSLKFLPKLRYICSNKELSSADTAAAGWPSFEKIDIDGCENLKSLPRGFAKAENLKICCPANWWEALEWEDDAFKRQLCSKVVTR